MVRLNALVGRVEPANFRVLNQISKEFLEEAGHELANS